MKPINLTQASCTAFEGDEVPLQHDEAEVLAQQLHQDWNISIDTRSIARSFKFRDFYQTMEFVDSVAAMVHQEDHHPYIELSYNRCLIRYTTHTLHGLSFNDFICAAKIDRLIA